MNLDIGKTYTFNTVAPSILGTSIKNAKLVAVLDYQTALSFDNIDLKYRSIYPLLPANTQDTPELNIYYRFQTESGEKIIMADIWIQESTIETIEHVNFQILFTQASMKDIPRIKDALNAMGYLNFQIKKL
jgi:hypothetical protein